MMQAPWAGDMRVQLPSGSGGKGSPGIGLEDDGDPAGVNGGWDSVKVLGRVALDTN